MNNRTKYGSLAKKFNDRIRNFKKIFGNETTLPQQLIKGVALISIPEDYWTDKGYLRSSAFEHLDKLKSLETTISGLESALSSPKTLYENAKASIKENALSEKVLPRTDMKHIEEEILSREAIVRIWSRLRSKWYDKFGGYADDTEGFYKEFGENKSLKKAYDTFYGINGTYDSPNSYLELLRQIKMFRSTLK